MMPVVPLPSKNELMIWSLFPVIYKINVIFVHEAELSIISYLETYDVLSLSMER